MKSEELEKLDKGKLIELILHQDFNLRCLKNIHTKRDARQEKVGQIFINGRRHKVIFEEES